jgi:hypothetical protein
MLPETIKIGGIEYKIKMVNECDEDNLNVDGKIVFPKQEIRIKKGLEKQSEAPVQLVLKTFS